MPPVSTPHDLLSHSLYELFCLLPLPRRAHVPSLVLARGVDNDVGRVPEQQYTPREESNPENNVDEVRGPIRRRRENPYADDQANESAEDVSLYIETHRRDVIQRNIFARASTQPAFPPIEDHPLVRDGAEDVSGHHRLLAGVARILNHGCSPAPRCFLRQRASWYSGAAPGASFCTNAPKTPYSLRASPARCSRP
jgi:hypothetical protein